MRTELSSQGRAKYKSSAWKDGFRSALQVRVSHAPQITFILPPQHFYTDIRALCTRALNQFSSPCVRANTKSVQRIQMLLVPPYFSVRSLPEMAFCKTIHSVACTKRSGKPPFSYIIQSTPNFISDFRTLCSVTLCIDGAWLHEMLPYRSFLVLSLIAWVTMNPPCSPLSLSMILPLTQP